MVPMLSEFLPPYNETATIRHIVAIIVTNVISVKHAGKQNAMQEMIDQTIITIWSIIATNIKAITAFSHPGRD